MINKITPETAFVDEKEMKAAMKVMDSKKLSVYSGTVNSFYEKNLAKYFGSRFAVSVSSGTAALHSALYALDIGVGDEVLVSATSLPLTVLPVIFRGAQPVFVDSKKESLDFDYEDMGKRVTSKTKAILVGYLWGYPIDIIRLKKFAKKHSLKIIEDAAQAHGSKFENKSLGTIGDIGCFSTFESKMIATGEGGFILTDKKEFYEKIRFFIAHCRDYEIKEGIPKIDYREVGWNYRISELTAAIGDVQIGKIDRRIKIRKSNFNYLVQGISKLNNIKPYKPDYVSFDRLNYYSALFLINERLDGVKVASKLYELGIPTDLTCYNYRVCYDHTLFKKDLKYKKYRCENAESLTRRLINLPTYENLEKDDLDYMLRCIDKEVG